MTIIQATIGSFVVFLSLTDCIGPSDPDSITYLADRWMGCVKKTKENLDESSTVPVVNGPMTTRPLPVQKKMLAEKGAYHSSSSIVHPPCL